MRYKMYIYALTNDAYAQSSVVKLGKTETPPNRLSTYRTSYPPKYKGPEASFEPYFLRIWRTDAANDVELRREEDAIFRRFYRCRLSREDGKNSEWFDFRELSVAVNMDVAALLDGYARAQRWVEVKLEDLPRKTYANPLQFDRNERFVHRAGDRLAILTRMQAPAIQAIYEFFASGKPVGHLVAPCGFGKTYVTIQALIRSMAEHIIVCCPRIKIAYQWAQEFHRHNIPVQLLGDGHRFADIRAPPTGPHVIISTYNMSDYLRSVPNLGWYLIILDEVHHMAGVAGLEEAPVEGLSKTRRFFVHCKERGIPTLGLTYTPRVVTGARDGFRVLSMDDGGFGPCIHETKYRDCVNAGILPTYRIHIVQAEDATADQLSCRVAALLKTLDAVNDAESPLVTRPLIMVGNRHDGELVAQKLQGVANARWVHGGNGRGKRRADEAWFREDTADQRSLISCRLFGEGVDFPRADCTAFLYDKTSREETVQMLFRAGRGHPDKPEFHVVLPLGNSDDLSGLEGILMQIAQIDGALVSDLRFAHDDQTRQHPPQVSPAGEFLGWDNPQIVSFDVPGDSHEQLAKVFQQVRRRLLGGRVTANQVYKWCKECGVRSSADYRARRESWLPVDFKPSCSWYEFLHGAPLDPSWVDHLRDLTRDYFPTAEEWPAWAEANNIAVSVQEIDDNAVAGYNFTTLRTALDTNRRRR